MTVSQEEIDARYYPMLAFEGESAEASLRAAWGTYKALPPETRKKLMSSALPLKLRSLAGDFSVKGADIVRMSGIIRELFFNKKTVEAAAEEISSFTGADKAKLSEFIEKNVLTVQPDPEAVSAAEESAPVSLEKLPLLAALGKYARLSEQQLSREKIRIKSQPDPVRPSLVNWLRSYRDELGVGYHDPVLRAKFLFNSPNCKSLSSEERERLNLVLRSVEDNVPVDIDVRKMEIVFPSFSVTDGQVVPKPTPKTVSQPISAPEKKVSAEGKPKSLLEALQSTPVAAPAAKPFTPPQAPKRAVPPVPIAPVPATPQAAVAPQAVAQESGFRIGKGMHFTSLETKPTPEKKPPAGQDDQFSFSSNHTLQSEQGGSQKFAIKQQSGGTIPSGESFFDKSKGAAPAGPSPAQKMNPFQIRPVSLHGKSGDEDMGRIVDLKNE